MLLGRAAVPAWHPELLNGAGEAPAWLCLRLPPAQERAPALSQNRGVLCVRKDPRGWSRPALGVSHGVKRLHLEIGAAGEPWRGLSLGGSLQGLAVPENAAGTVPVPR